MEKWGETHAAFFFKKVKFSFEKIILLKGFDKWLYLYTFTIKTGC